MTARGKTTHPPEPDPMTLDEPLAIDLDQFKPRAPDYKLVATARRADGSYGHAHPVGVGCRRGDADS
jgi:hypothetical protein